MSYTVCNKKISLMIQEIITYIIIALAGIYTLYGIFRFFVPGKNSKKSACGGACSGSCELKHKFQAKTHSVI